MTTKSMTTKEVLKELEALGHESVCARYAKSPGAKKGAGDNSFGVKLGDLRKVAKKLKTNHKLALELWDTENIDARLLAILVMKPAELSATEMDRLVRSVTLMQVAEWLTSYIVKQHPDKEALREKWMKAKDPMAARAGWALTAERVAKRPEGLDLPALLDRIEAEMGKAPYDLQWTMNSCLAAIGIHNPKLRKRALAIGEKLGVFRDYPTSKGCTSPFAPIWIEEMVRRQG